MKALARISLKNRALIALISVCAVIFGTIAATSLKQELLPELEFPQAMVISQYTGASPEAVEREVTEPLENALNGVESVEKISSTSSAGSSTITVDTDYGTNSDDVVRELQRAVSGVESQLPDGVTPTVMTGSSADIPVVVTSVTSDKNMDELASDTENVVIPELKKVDGVREASLFGLTPKHVEVRVREDDLADEGVSIDALTSLLQANGIPTSAGEMTRDGVKTPVEVGAKLESVQAIRDLQVQGENGPVAVSDVADVDLKDDEVTNISRTNGQASLTLQVTKKPDANTVEVSEAVQAKLTELEDQLGSNTKFVLVFDQAPFITSSIDDLLSEGALGLVFAVLVILVFLLSVRATLITAISIPLSLLITLIAVWQTGYSLNMLTLAALTMSIGRVVDDSIVVIESIRRRQSLGGTKFKNILAAVSEVAGAITASTLTTVAVFLPLAFVSGQVGEMFRPFALTTTIALLSSLLVALTIVPVLAYWFLRNRESRVKLSRDDKAEIKKIRRANLAEWKAERKEARKRRAEHKNQPAGRYATSEMPVVTASAGTLPYTEVEGGEGADIDELATLRSPVTRLQKTYTPILSWVMKRPIITLILAVVVLAGTGVMVPLLKTSNFGDMGSDSIQVSQTFEPGVSLEQADEKVREVEDLLAAQDGVESYQTSIQSGADMFGGSTEGSVETTYMINLSDGAELGTVRGELSQKFDGLQDAGDIELLNNQGPAGDNSISVTLTSNDLDALETGAEDLTQALGSIDGVERASNTLQSTAPIITVDIDKEEAADRGLTEQGIGQIVQRAMRGQNIGQVIIDSTTHQVLLFDGEVDTLNKLRQLEIPYQEQTVQASPVPGAPGTPTTQERTVELQDVANVEQTTTAPVITRTDGLRSATVTVQPQGDDLGAVSQQVNQTIADADLPSGVTTATEGAAAEMQDGFKQMGLAMLAAILIVFVILVATFKSLLQPFILLISIPFAATGSVGLLLLTDVPLSMTAMIGLLMLIGIVVTNAIVLIDLINHYRFHGIDLRTAIFHGARQRYRPILMTAAATVFAMLPMAFGLTGGGSFVSRDLAIVVIGGLVSSTLLTLILVPALYQLLEGVKERRAEKRAVKNMARESVIDAAEARAAGSEK